MAAYQPEAGVRRDQSTWFRNRQPLSGALFLQQAQTVVPGIFDNLRDIADFDKQPPLQVTFRPMSEQDLLNSDDRRSGSGEIQQRSRSSNR